MSMLFFGTHMINEAEVLYIDLWHTSESAKIRFVDGETLILGADATLEARQFAEDGRRVLRAEDEDTILNLERDRLWVERDRKDLNKPRKSKKKV